MIILGIDIGGTQIRSGIIERGELKKVCTIPTPSNGTEAEVLEAIAKLVELYSDYKLKYIGIGVPSVVNVEKGIVYNVTNIPSWKEVHLKDYLETRFKVPVYVNNDANCFVSGEKYFGKGQQFQSLVGITLGTGLGAGLIINNHLYEGRNCGAGELCNLPYLDRNYEYYCSGQFFKDELKVSGNDVALLAVEGDASALKMLDQFGSHLGKFMQAVLYAYDTEAVVLGGSVASSFPYFKESMYRSMAKDFIFPKSLENFKIEVSELENIAIYGAASLVLDK